MYTWPTCRLWDDFRRSLRPVDAKTFQFVLSIKLLHLRFNWEKLVIYIVPFFKVKFVSRQVRTPALSLGVLVIPSSEYLLNIFLLNGRNNSKTVCVAVIGNFDTKKQIIDCLKLNLVSRYCHPFTDSSVHLSVRKTFVFVIEIGKMQSIPPGKLRNTPYVPDYQPFRSVYKCRLITPWIITPFYKHSYVQESPCSRQKSEASRIRIHIREDSFMTLHGEVQPESESTQP